MSPVAWITLLLGCLASVEDVRRRTIANRITVAGLAAGLTVHGWDRGWAGLAWSAGGALAGFGVLLLFYLMGGMGAGDLKLSAAFGALLGPSGALLAALLAAAIGAILAAGFLLLQRGTRAIPYAPALSLGALLALLGRT